MALLNLSLDELLSTTRSVRKRLDLTRPVEPEVIQQCLELAVQAPTGANNQNWHFVVVTDKAKRQALGDIYRRGFAQYMQQMWSGQVVPASSLEKQDREAMRRVRSSSQYLIEHIHEVPVLVIPCIRDRTDGTPVVEQAGSWGSILPAVWNFMLAARARGLGSCWTTVHLYYEREAAIVLDIPYEQVMQVALIPIAYTLGTDFKPAVRKPLQEIVHWDRW
ncbi:MAG: nitroreductase family protein [Ktedonobacteraceae bacterium]|nr:nitroreductase family protein [Ktedonobacteraceae bacterium]MBO0792983.1 nitroreductase family protein [Ktedonobacteraceae bacterium]